MAGYAMAPGATSVVTLLSTMVGTGLCVASANAINQWTEAPYDAQMARTRTRVLVRHALSPAHAFLAGALAGVGGVGILAAAVGPLAAALGGINILIYTCIYTPMKRTSIANTWAGAVVGAIPPMIGWAACTGGLEPGAWILAGILYAWQFPHFNALSWNLRPDYSKAGYRMMSVTDPALNSRVSLRYALALFPLSYAACYWDLTSWWFLIDSSLVNGYMAWCAYVFWRRSNDKSARTLFFSSLYLYDYSHCPRIVELCKQPSTNTNNNINNNNNTQTGRNFVRRPGAKVYLQCRFNNEILTTDPTDSTVAPIWDTELAWDIDSKLLGFLRSQRAVLKLICFAIDAAGRRESLGYLMLDLRAATQGSPPFPEKWMPLVHSKATGSTNTAFRPEIKISFVVVPKKSEAELAAEAAEIAASLQQTVFSSSASASALPAALTVGDNELSAGVVRRRQNARRSDTTTSAQSKLPGSMRPRSAVAGTRRANAAAGSTFTSIPIELKSEGYYQLGHGTSFFNLWITIAFAEHLSVLLDDTISAAAVSGPSGSTSRSTSEFYFYYSFLGIDITTHRFADLSNPNFPAERVSIRFRSSQEDLKVFFREISRILVYLCQDGRIVGFADVPLSTLLEEEDGSGRDMAVVEKIFPLYNAKEELPLSVDGWSKVDFSSAGTEATANSR
eukprot:jgi/Hompol1/5288/HPOL_002649-RA